MSSVGVRLRPEVRSGDTSPEHARRFRPGSAHPARCFGREGPLFGGRGPIQRMGSGPPKFASWPKAASEERNVQIRALGPQACSGDVSADHTSGRRAAIPKSDVMQRSPPSTWTHPYACFRLVQHIEKSPIRVQLEIFLWARPGGQLHKKDHEVDEGAEGGSKERRSPKESMVAQRRGRIRPHIAPLVEFGAKFGRARSKSGRHRPRGVVETGQSWGPTLTDLGRCRPKFTISRSNSRVCRST